MPALAFDVPSSFWNEFDSTTLHFRRVRPGDFDPIPTDLAEPFFAGSGPLALPPGWHEFLEVQLNEEENAQVFAAIEALIESQADAPWMLELLLGPKKRS